MSIEMITLSSRDEWLKNRKNGIGGSEISAVIGQNPYMTNIELWELKTGRKQPEDISEKPYIKYGTQAEMKAKAEAEATKTQIETKTVEEPAREGIA
jgi:putative phage-type endonuclease